MSLYENLKAANINALKTGNKTARAVLSVVVNKALLEEKENNSTVSDEEVLNIIIKTKKELSEEKQGYIKANNPARVEEITKQEEVIEVFIPKQLSENEIRAEIAKLEDKSLPFVMKHFKINFTGRVDMGLVSRITKDI